jgi:superfamily II DNA or RNA helicase
MSADDTLALGVLDQLEQLEARLLSWGLVDAFTPATDLERIVEEQIERLESFDGLTLTTVGAVIDALIERALIFDVGEDPGERYRSRMAEGVRLMFRLRQLFPKHDGPNGWQVAPSLVADFRFIWRRRRYPKREIRPADALADIGSSAEDAETRAALSALIGRYGPNFRLAEFQIEAAKRILGGFAQPYSRATLVSAGTGSGKTLSFYLPALARVAAHIQRDKPNSRWVKVLALYPRNELLKDQFAEVYDQARSLDAELVSKGRRKILIGTLFGPTPQSHKSVATGHDKWPPHPDGLICEYIRCPTDDCGGDLVWRTEDRENQVESLQCDACGHRIGSDEIVLTRDRLEAVSPDILFTTTEMLNQRMGDSQYRHLFGLGSRTERAVEMMLLDEVHTYSGRSGAQVAFLLRRWRRMLRKPVSFVGLSATLRDGARFFARLTGLIEQAAMEIAPVASQMVEEGAEYMLALRGDPVSRTALLSTTIQAAMLTSRMLDAPRTRKSGGVLGERLFLFTDDLDVTNRMFFAMLDAEGRNAFGRHDMNRHPRGGLSVLRRPMPNRQRKLHGQDWEAPLAIGHGLNLSDRKAVGRVMSLDPGVGKNLDIVVATATLEVGFNDPLVGAVIQHKAPRDVAQFLQRKGRAGRSRRMRPWTVVVLSDYGRDRIAYQAYDLLFDPELSVRSLPTGNRYVRRIQSVYATFDYLSEQLGGAPKGSVWRDLVKPSGWSDGRTRQSRLAQAITRILSEPAERERYAQYLAKALRLEEEEIDLLLWDQPRPLLTEVLPTALRRLETRWTQNPPFAEPVINNSPLPEFVPANLFSDLNLPEVSINLPPLNGQNVDPRVMPILQAMRDFAPGRVSRRYALQHGGERHWVCPPLDDSPRQSIEVSTVMDAELLGHWSAWSGDAVFTLPVLRPLTIRTTQTPPNVLDTSQARLDWRTQIVTRSEGLALPLPRNNPWTDLVSEVRFLTHQNLSPVEMRRFAIASHADIRYRDGSSTRKTFTFHDTEAQAAVGFSIAVDALRLSITCPPDLWSSLGTEEDGLYRAIRTARFHDQARQGPFLASVDNVFAREWLAQLLICALTGEAVLKGVSLQEAASNLERGQADLSLQATLTVLFQSAMVDDADGHGNTQDRLRADLEGYLQDAAVISDLHRLASILWTPVHATWEPWLRERFTTTVAAAAMKAIASLCPEIDSDSLVVDVAAGPREDDDIFRESASAELWISELAPGGNGQIEEVLKQYADDPRRFFSLMAAALRDNDFLLSDFQMTRFLRSVQGDPAGELGQATAGYRAAYGASKSYTRFTVLRETLARQGYVTSHSFIVALANRILRPGSGPASDAFLLDALTRWSTEEERLGVELDARVLAYRLATLPRIDEALMEAGIETPAVGAEQWRFSVIYSLLWPRGAQIRRSGLELYSPFGELAPAEPLLVKAFLSDGLDSIDVRDDDWRTLCLERLGEVGAATLICQMEDSDRLSQAFTFLATNPVQSNYLSVFARVQAVRRMGDTLAVDVDIAEAVQ